MHTKTLSTITVIMSPISRAMASGGGCGKQSPSPRIVRLQKRSEHYVSLPSLRISRRGLFNL